MLSLVAAAANETQKGQISQKQVYKADGVFMIPKLLGGHWWTLKIENFGT